MTALHLHDPNNRLRQQTALEAAKRYLAMVSSLDNTPQAMKLLTKDYLTELQEEYKDVGLSLATLSTHGQHFEAERIRMKHLKLRQSVLEDVIKEISRRPLKVIRILRKDFKELHPYLQNEIIPQLSQITESMWEHPFYQKMYESGRKDTHGRYVPTDRIFDKGFDRVFEAKRYRNRLYELLLVPREVRRVQWEFMLSVADAAYKIQPEPENPAPFKTVAHLYARLAENERGADNKHMAPTHKMRHNASLHSLHSCELLDKVSYEARKKIRALNIEEEMRKQALQKLAAIRQHEMMLLVVHDVGEIEGEIGQGIKEAEEMTREEAQALKKDKGVIEREMFEKHLELALSATKVPKHAKDAAAKLLEDAYEGAERGDTFEGRITTAIEKTNSGHDYVRFNKAPGAKRLRNATRRNKDFSQWYAFKKLYDIKEPDDPLGKNALQNLISDTNTVQGIAELAIHDALIEELDKHNVRQSHAYGRSPLDLVKYDRASRSR